MAPPIHDDAYIPALRDIAREERVDAVIPTIDTDLLKLAEAADQFAQLGAAVLTPNAEVVAICRNKDLTFQHFRRHQIDTPETWTRAEADVKSDWVFPVFGKPNSGSSSLGLAKIRSARELAQYLAGREDAIVQAFITGVEYTLDVYVGLRGAVGCVVPRRRLAVRSGEVSKGITVKDPAIMQAGRRVAESFGPSGRGLLTIQCIVTSENRICCIECNPRFGGGAPLGIAAGADYPAWLLLELCQVDPRVSYDGWRDRLCMLRYDWSVFVADDEMTRPEDATPLSPPPLFVSPPPVAQEQD